jgi:hypothetical protein
VAVGDVDGDGRDDLIGCSATGRCWVALSEGELLKPHIWGQLPGPVAGLCVGDFDADGRADVAWRDAVTGALWVGLSDGTAFRFARWGSWPASGPLTPLRVYKPWR